MPYFPTAEVVEVPLATETTPGLMSGADKAKLDNLQPGAGAIQLQDEGVVVAATTSLLNFVGSGVTASANGTVTIPGGGGGSGVDSFAGRTGTVVPVSGDYNLSTLPDVSSALAGKSNVGHTHAISDVSALQTTLDGKASVASVAAKADITYVDAQIALHTADSPLVIVSANGTLPGPSCIITGGTAFTLRSDTNIQNGKNETASAITLTPAAGESWRSGSNGSVAAGAVYTVQRVTGGQVLRIV